MTQPQKYSADMLRRFRTALALPEFEDLDEVIELVEKMNANDLVLLDTKKEGDQLAAKIEALQLQAGTLQYGEPVVPMKELRKYLGKD